MYKSMTGYGRFEGQDDLCAQTWEIRSVNGKQFSARLKLPSFLAAMETEWEKELRRFGTRGRIEVGCHVQLTGPGAVGPALNRPLALAMIDEVATLAQARGAAFEPDYSRLLHVSALWQDASSEPDPDLMARLTAGFITALEDWDRSRLREGASLIQDLTGRVDQIAAWVEDLRTTTANLAQDRFAALTQRVKVLLGEVGVSIDHERMLQELAVIVDRMDVSEELTRLSTHIGELRRLFAGEPAGGRKLDFLLQECFREINTCGNKAQDVQASRIVIEIKTELEKCREQVQNLE